MPKPNPIELRPLGTENYCMRRICRTAGTTLLEVLVVIVIFLVGILAIVQVFPKGFQILLLSRSASVANSLAKTEVERLRANSSQLPEAVVSMRLDGTIDTTRTMRDLGPAGTALQANGNLILNDQSLGDWAYFTGANNMRHVIGEGQRVPAPRYVGASRANAAYHGGLMLLQFAPVDYRPALESAYGKIVAYGNDLVVHKGDWDPADERSSVSDIFISQDGSQIRLPAGTRDRTYRISFTGTARTESSGWERRDFIGLFLTVPAANEGDLYTQSVPALLGLNNGNGQYTGLTLGSVDVDSVRVQRRFDETGGTWTGDPYEFRILNGTLGALLFTPVAHTYFINRNGVREPLVARVDYDVLDWRILKDDFRIPETGQITHRLPIAPLRVAGMAGPDGRPMAGMPGVETSTLGSRVPSPFILGQRGGVDTFFLMDLDTGGIFQECREIPDFRTLVSVDKGRGMISFGDDVDSTPTLEGRMRLLDGSVRTNVGIHGRMVRAFYMARNETEVQVSKAPSLFTPVAGTPGFGQYSITGARKYLIYFAPSVAGSNITFGQISVRPVNRVSGQPTRVAQTFYGVTLEARTRSGETGASVDVSSLIPGLTTDEVAVVDYGIDSSSPAIAVKDVKSSSVSVRAIWNPQFVKLGADAVDNIRQIDRWGQGWRRSTTETFLEQGDMFK